MMPANGLEQSPTVGHVNGFVADLAEIARAIAAKDFEYLLGASGASQSGYRSVGGGFIPMVHGFEEGRFGFWRTRDSGLDGWRHGPVPLADILGLRVFEGVKRPEYGQPPIGVRGGNAGQVSGVDHQDGMEFEADRAGLDVPNSREQQCCQNF